MDDSVISEAVGAAVSKYGAIAGGIVIGTAAKYGLALTDGKRLTVRGVIADVLLLGFLGLLAVMVSDWFHLTGNAKVLAGALAAVSSDRLIRLARDRFMKAADVHIGTLLPGSEVEAIVRVPAGVGEPQSVSVENPPVGDETTLGRTLRTRFAQIPVNTPRDMSEMLDKLD